MKLLRTLLATATAMAFCAPALAQDKLTVRLDFSPWGVQAAMHLAKNKGWFKDANLDVDIQDGRGSGNTVQLVNAGQADVGQVQVGLVGSARAQGATIKSIATFQRKTDLCILVDRDSPVKSVADLKDKTVVVFAASPWAPFIDLYLKSGGMTRDTVKVDFVDPAALWGTYTAKRSDGLMSTVGSALPLAKGPRPSKCLLASDAGIAFPPSTDGFRAARVGGDLHVSFTIDADDADAFDERSGLHLAAGKRVITHSSPLWELNPSGEISGGASADSAVKRTVEIVTPAVDTDPLQVRLVISPAPSE